jgi:hypothetical protein
MTPNSIIAALIAQLKNSASLSYVDDNHIYEGAREGIVNFPCLVIELVGEKVVETSYPFEHLVMTLLIHGSIKDYSKDHQLTDNTLTKGPSTFMNDVKKAIYYDHTFGLAEVYDATCIDSRAGNNNYPTREILLTVEIKYRTDRKLRT